MKALVMILLPIAIGVGCTRSGLIQPEAGIQEYFVDVMIEADGAGNLYVDEHGGYEAFCRLGRIIAKDNSVQRSVIESQAVIPPGRDLGSLDALSCRFKETLPFRFCAMTSVQSEMDCRVNRGGGPGWFVEIEFSEPESPYLHCTIACFDLVRN